LIPPAKEKNVLETLTQAPYALGLLARITDVLAVISVLSVWVLLRRARRDGAGPLTFGVALLAALGWGALWIWYPPLAAFRLAPPPGGQVMAIAGVLLGLVALLLLPSVRRYARTADLFAFAALGFWRVIFGAMLWIIGALGGLPLAFYASAGAGDILVGVWGLSILARKPSVSIRELTLWNAAGLADLLHVLALGAVHLRPFYLSHPDVPTLNLLPLVGVPLFIALHIYALWGLAQRTRTARA
jgi:hypothetical protein